MTLHDVSTDWSHYRNGVDRMWVKNGFLHLLLLKKNLKFFASLKHEMLLCNWKKKNQSIKTNFFPCTYVPDPKKQVLLLKDFFFFYIWNEESKHEHYRDQEFVSVVIKLCGIINGIVFGMDLEMMALMVGFGGKPSIWWILAVFDSL